MCSQGDQLTCHLSFNHIDQDGTADGTCAAGFGTCCTFTAPCDSETSQNGTYFSRFGLVSLMGSYSPQPIRFHPHGVQPHDQPHEQQHLPGNCRGLFFLIEAEETQLSRQVRLNFEEVELLDPDSTGNCRTDYMHVSPTSTTVPVTTCR